MKCWQQSQIIQTMQHYCINHVHTLIQGWFSASSIVIRFLKEKMQLCKYSRTTPSDRARRSVVQQTVTLRITARPNFHRNIQFPEGARKRLNGNTCQKVRRGSHFTKKVFLQHFVIVFFSGFIYHTVQQKYIFTGWLAVYSHVGQECTSLGFYKA